MLQMSVEFSLQATTLNISLVEKLRAYLQSWDVTHDRKSMLDSDYWKRTYEPLIQILSSLSGIQLCGPAQVTLALPNGGEVSLRAESVQPEGPLYMGRELEIRKLFRLTIQPQSYGTGPGDMSPYMTSDVRGKNSTPTEELLLSRPTSSKSDRHTNRQLVTCPSCSQRLLLDLHG
jgi:hypothetical protein